MNKIVLGILLLVFGVISLFVGNHDIALTDIFKMSDDQLLVFTISRIPRTLTLILCGMGIAVAGFLMQQLTQNRFVSPTTAGTLDAAKLGILFGLIWVPQAGMLTRLALSVVFCFLASLIFLYFIRSIKSKDIILVPIIGIMFGSILNAFATFFAVKYGIVQNVQDWLIGDFSGILQGQYESIYLILPIVVLTYIFANRFTVISLGESFAKNLGLNYEVYLNIGILCVSLIVSATVVTVGAIPFLGLVIPNIIRIYKGDNMKAILPYTAMFGAVFLLFCDILGRIIIAPYEVPIGLMVGIFGGIIFFGLLWRQKR
ncbi:MAG TPA: iron chelate uptake ABC transporter family permease subunit [Candidatus Sphingobacterium stercoripullorum]|uniref:Iron chelate uptake ABC transporter family permease subunit n=1 Tax=Candidatus Sphingobacterium stercoripullorum TaxID=2838759 RepID=A0A9D1WA72_9SPHI|nr:iron chelate uptake ABC transporter family permease subunit [Candidatus Sphingobacterium stercoripullorum]